MSHNLSNDTLNLKGRNPLGELVAN